MAIFRTWEAIKIFATTAISILKQKPGKTFFVARFWKF